MFLNMLRDYHQRICILIFWLLMAAVGVMSLLPTSYLPPASFDFWDKAQHALAYAALCVLALLAYPQATYRVVSGLLAYGAVIELLQAASGWRHGSILDELANALGVVAGFLLVFGWRKLWPVQFR
jgi:VanZ family protein